LKGEKLNAVKVLVRKGWKVLSLG